MTPTNELRFVERKVQPTSAPAITIRILQQKWVETDPHEYSCGDVEWHDVPLVKED